MSRRALVLALATSAFACKSVATDSRDPAHAAASDAPKAVASAATSTPDAAAEPVRLAPLAWGTRPAENGPLYPVVDGMCIHGEIWPTKSSALYTYGNGTGAWTRGSSATVARLVDDGLENVEAVTGKNAEAWGELAPIQVEGAWPGPMLVYSYDGGGGRMRDWPSIWTRSAEGFKLVASHREAKAPYYAQPTLFRGNIVTARREETNDGFSPSVFKAFPFAEGAAAVANLPSLGRAKFVPQQIASNDTTIFAAGVVEESGYTPVLRMLSEGTVKEVPLPEGVRIVGTRPSLLLAVDGSRLLRLSADQRKVVPVKLPSTKMIGVEQDSKGDIWVLPESRKSVLVVRADDKVDELVIPPPASPRPPEAVMHWPTSGRALAGVDVDEPYVIGEAGALYRLDSGKWVEIPLPKPPFAASGKYQAQALVVPAKGDLYVNAGYAEKGVGWKTPERYRAVLRTRRPKEVLRCNEPQGGSSSGSGRGFMSFPPIAEDACATPFAVLLRLAYGVNDQDATYIYDRKSDYPTVREAIKATPSLGASVDLVELVSGNQRFLGARVPNVAAGRELAATVAKRIVGYAETRPEIVCGTPKEERVIHVDVATGKVGTVAVAQ